MKKFIIILLILLLVGGFAVVYFVFGQDKGIPILDTEEENVDVSYYHIYGTHLNMTGTLNLEDTDFEDIKLTLYNGEFKDFDINYELDGSKIEFNLSDEINNGLYLDGIDRGTYYAFIKVSYENPENEEENIEKYYVLDNSTEYAEVAYYTFSSIDNKININSENDYATMMFEVEENNDKSDIVDFVIDPGHGGIDGGAEAFGHSERDYTYDLASKLAESLEEAGYTVALTRDELDPNTYFDEYNAGGRAVISHEKNAKYVLSLHFNSSSSSSVNGLEIYSPSDINYDFVRSLAENITTETGLNYSPRGTYKIYDGVYVHNFSEEEIASSNENTASRGYATYDITTNSNYYYMIRETGGIMTGAYVDDRNEEGVGYNPYYNSNIGAEAYVLELGYITNANDFEVISNNRDSYVTAITNSIKNNLLK